FHGFLNLDTSGTSHGFQQNGNALSVINVPFAGVTSQSASGIDNAGRIVGSFQDAHSRSHGYLKIGSTFTVIDVPFAGVTHTFASSINNAGQIVGQYSDASGTHGFLATPIVPFPAPAFAITAVAPNRGGNTGSVTATLLSTVGCGFQPGA